MFFQIVTALLRKNLMQEKEEESIRKGIQAKNQSSPLTQTQKMGKRRKQSYHLWMKLDLETKELSLGSDTERRHQIVNCDGSKINIEHLMEEIRIEPGILDEATQE